MKRKELKQLIKTVLKEIIHHHHDDMDSPEGAEAMRSAARHNLDDFTKAYMVAALWSSMTNTNDQGGDPLDKNYELDDIEDDTFHKMVEDCKDFQKKYGELYERGGWSDEQAGHDFWLTRNGHGSGFWDRGYGQPDEIKEIGKQLTKAAKSYGTFDLYLAGGALDGLIAGN